MDYLRGVFVDLGRMAVSCGCAWIGLRLFSGAQPESAAVIAVGALVLAAQAHHYPKAL